MEIIKKESIQKAQKVTITSFLLITLFFSLNTILGNEKSSTSGIGKENSGALEKESNETGTVKHHTFGKVVLWTIAAVAVAAVIYFTVIKKPEYKLTVEVGNGVEGSPAAGVYKYKKGSTVSYDFRKLAGYGSLNVTLDGSLVAASGSITMDKEHSLKVSALEIGNYVSIQLRVKYNLKLYAVGSGAKTACLKDGSTLLISLTMDDPAIGRYCPDIMLSNPTCNDAFECYVKEIDYNLEKTYVDIYQQYIAIRCSICPREIRPLVCSAFTITVSSYTWEQGKSDPGIPQIQNLGNLPIDIIKDCIQDLESGVCYQKTVRLEFVRPSNPQAAQRVFRVGGCL